MSLSQFVLDKLLFLDYRNGTGKGRSISRHPLKTEINTKSYDFLPFRRCFGVNKLKNSLDLRLKIAHRGILTIKCVYAIIQVRRTSAYGGGAPLFCYRNSQNLDFFILGIFYLERCAVDVRGVGTFRKRGRGVAALRTV